MEEAECNRRGESKILTVFRLFIIEFLSLYHTLKSSIHIGYEDCLFKTRHFVKTFNQKW